MPQTQRLVPGWWTIWLCWAQTDERLRWTHRSLIAMLIGIPFQRRRSGVKGLFGDWKKESLEQEGVILGLKGKDCWDVCGAFWWFWEFPPCLGSGHLDSSWRSLVYKGSDVELILFCSFSFEKWVRVQTWRYQNLNVFTITQYTWFFNPYYIL